MSHRYPHQRQPRVDKVFAEKLKSAFSGVHISPCGHPDCPVLSDVDRAVKLLSQNIDLWAPAGSTTVLLRTPRKAMSMAGMHSSGRNSCDQVTINYGSRKSINREPLRGTLLLLQAADEEWGIFWPRKPRFEMAMAAAAQSGYTFVSQESSGNPHLITPTGELTYFHSPGDINCDVDSGGGHVCPSLYRQTTLIGTHDTCGVSNLSGVNNHCDNNTHTHTHSGYPCNVISLDHTHTHTHTYSHGHSNDTLGPMTSHQRARSEDPGQRRDELKLPLIKLKPSGRDFEMLQRLQDLHAKTSPHAYATSKPSKPSKNITKNRHTRLDTRALNSERVALHCHKRTASEEEIQRYARPSGYDGVQGQANKVDTSPQYTGGGGANSMLIPDTAAGDIITTAPYIVPYVPEVNVTADKSMLTLSFQSHPTGGRHEKALPSHHPSYHPSHRVIQGDDREDRIWGDDRVWGDDSVRVSI
eukprot:GHVR01123109.1.p1 GENE.GHVR01123109.1~~GHVR01123109.1.p1  ORF type:complete len:470 (+),score=145.73 GHVR01123109.1:349-1758(+)